MVDTSMREPALKLQPEFKLEGEFIRELTFDAELEQKQLTQGGTTEHGSGTPIDA